ncbi:MAG: ABC transporter permease [Phenylobacterium sp.]|nr:MAG: ABC transporter permease [Phenylobacterium sp.]
MSRRRPEVAGVGPIRVYTPEPPMGRLGQFMIDMWADLLASRELAWRLTVRDFSAMYRQSYAGYVWAFLPPLFASATFLLLRSGGVISVGDTGIPYPAFIFIGTLLWQVFVDALNNPARAMQTSMDMLVKVNFPREALVLSAVEMSLIGLAMRLVILVPVLAWYRFPLNASMALFPVGALGLVLLGTVMGLFLGTIGMLYQDVQRAIGIITTFWMFLTPVIAPGVRHGAIGVIMRLNPVTPILATTRDWLTGQPPEFLGGFFIVMGLTVVGLVAALMMYRLFLPRIVERLGM